MRSGVNQIRDPAFFFVLDGSEPELRGWLCRSLFMRFNEPHPYSSGFRQPGDSNLGRRPLDPVHDQSLRSGDRPLARAGGDD